MDNFTLISEREKGLQRRLTGSQMAMIALGGAIGTGLFLGSSFAIGVAGPSVLFSYAIGALISLFLMGCLAEMTVAHPTSGSFGAYAEHYISPLAGYLVRYAYWAALVLAVGVEVTAIGKYMAHWFPDVGAWIWVVVFSMALICVNGMSVRAFGSIEYVFSTIKIIAIVVFILVGAAVVFGNKSPEAGFGNYLDHGGFFPHGIWGMWVAVVIALFSYISIEMIAVAAGEAENPERAVLSAFRSTIVRLVVFYLFSLALIPAIIPWNEAGTDKSPFVRVMEITGIPGAAGTINFVVLVAALSAMNSQLYTSTRMMFSLSRAGFAPSVLGAVSSYGVPLPALLVSCTGVAVAIVLNIVWSDKSFEFMMAISIFGAMFTWLMIFITHLFFRVERAKGNYPLPAFRMWGFPVTTLLGAVFMAALMVTTWFTDMFRLTLITGIPFLVLLTIAYYFWYRPRTIPVLAEHQNG